MWWADSIRADIEERFGEFLGNGGTLVIRDEKTTSGRVHAGSMKGVAVHGTIAEVLQEAGIPVSFIYELNDNDPFDGIPSYVSQEEYAKYLGMPLRSVPTPPGTHAASFAEYYGNDFASVIQDSGYTPEISWCTALYESGKMDGPILRAIEHRALIREIYQRVSGSQKPEGWYPLNMVCEQCGKVMTTEVLEWDGTEATYRCRDIKLTPGCGYEGKASPFGGRSKLPWKVEWAAKWVAYGVHIEGAGKDHTTKGGAWQVADSIAREVFLYDTPLMVPYEFFLVGGAKMSSSKGNAVSAREVADMVPPELFRFLLTRNIGQTTDFDPAGDTIPVLFDTFDRSAEKVREGVADDVTRHLHFARLPGERHAPLPYLPRFSQIAFIVDMPHMNLKDEVALMKGAPLTPEDEAELAKRERFARIWLEQFARPEDRTILQESMPDVVISEDSKPALRALAEYFDTERTGDEVHQRLHELKDEFGVTPKELFQTIYAIFLNKDHGPKAGWFLSVLPREFVVARLTEATN